MPLLPSYRFEELKRIATDIIIEGHITEYPYNVFEVAKRLDIELISYQSLSLEKINACFEASEDGFTLQYMQGKDYICRIYYNGDMDENRIRFTIMHEIGHIFANHKEGNEVEEVEANFISSYVLAPPCIIYEKNVEDCFDLADKFKVSYSMAYYHFKKYNKWLRYWRNSCNEYEDKILSLYKNKV